GAFVVDRSAEGYRVVGREATMGFRASETVAVELDGVRVPDEDVLGDPEAGFACARDALDAGRLGVAAVSLGIAQAALEHSVAYATEREQFERPIADFGAIREKLARMATRIALARALAHSVAEDYREEAGAGNPGDGPGPRSRTARVGMAKAAASEAALWVADEAVQIYGGYGYMRDYPVEKLLRDAKGTEIFEGTNEILRELTARALLGEARDG
ncbi:MAG TPA: acyl-CoA dehydrogenase family protein, partial [Longimicrobiales bacterium]|nr:acyl-CoA dehydrogenase family protein [Longimicrobiales bacterium]